MMGTLWQDLRHGLRVLRASPGFAAVAVLSLGLGIGVNTMIFSVVNAVLLTPLPFPDSARLVRIGESNPNNETSPTLKSQIWSVDPNQPVASVSTMEQ